MELSPEFPAFEAGWKSGHNQLVTIRLAADLDTPVSLMLKLAEAAPMSFMLESVSWRRHCRLGENAFHLLGSAPRRRGFYAR